MKFAMLIGKTRRPQAWHSLGLSRLTRRYLGVASVVAAAIWLWPSYGEPAVTLVGLAVIAGLAMAFVPDRALRWYRARWVDRFELPLEREGYAAMLDGGTYYARIRTVIEGHRLRAPDLYGIVAHVVEATPERLVIESSTMQVGYPAYNLELHRWFVLLTARVLRRLHATATSHGSRRSTSRRRTPRCLAHEQARRGILGS